MPVLRHEPAKIYSRIKCSVCGVTVSIDDLCMDGEVCIHQAAKLQRKLLADGLEERSKCQS